MNGLTGIFKNMNLYHWVGVFLVLSGMITSVAWAYMRLDNVEDDVCTLELTDKEHDDMMQEMHETQLLLVDEVQDMNESLDDWMEKIYNLALNGDEGDD